MTISMNFNILRPENGQKAAIEGVLNDPNYRHVEVNDKGGLKATHVGHNTESLAKTTHRFWGLDPNQLEQACQDELFRMGHQAILTDENAKRPDGNKELNRQ